MHPSKNKCEATETAKSDPDLDSCDPIPTWFIVSVATFFVSWVVMVGAFIASRFL